MRYYDKNPGLKIHIFSFAFIVVVHGCINNTPQKATLQNYGESLYLLINISWKIDYTVFKSVRI